MEKANKNLVTTKEKTSKQKSVNALFKKLGKEVVKAGNRRKVLSVARKLRDALNE